MDELRVDENLERIADALEGIYRIFLNKECLEFGIITDQDMEDFLSEEAEM